MVQDARAANDETLLSDDDDRVFYKLPVWQRVVIMLGGPVMNLLFAIVLFAILLSGIGVQTATTTVSSVSECVIPADADRTECAASDPIAPAAAAGLQPGDVIVVGRRPADRARSPRHPRSSASRPASSLTIVVERDGAQQTLTLTPVTIEQPVTDAAGSRSSTRTATSQTAGGRVRRHPSGSRVPAPADLGRARRRASRTSAPSPGSSGSCR